MRKFVGWVLIVLGLLHGLHVFQINAGSVIDLNSGRFFSFSALDRLASTGLVGKVVVLLIDFSLVGLGLLELVGWRHRSISRRKKRSN
jgi:hypothetical protein